VWGPSPSLRSFPSCGMAPAVSLRRCSQLVIACILIGRPQCAVCADGAAEGAATDAAVEPPGVLPGSFAPGSSSLNVRSRFTWWEGDIMRMKTYRVLGLTMDCVVMCFGRPDGGGCRAAATGLVGLSANGGALAASAADDPRLLPTLPWGATQVFHNASIGRVEAERVNDDRFVVCFEAEDETGINTVACSLGLPDRQWQKEGATQDHQCGQGELRPFAAPVEIGKGHIVGVSAVLAGTRIAVCLRESNRGKSERAIEETFQHVVCSWIDVLDGDAAGPSLSLADEPPLPVAREPIPTVV